MLTSVSGWSGPRCLAKRFARPFRLNGCELGFAQVRERRRQTPPQSGFDERLRGEVLFQAWQRGFQGLAECHVPAQASRLALGCAAAMTLFSINSSTALASASRAWADCFASFSARAAATAFCSFSSAI